MTDTNKKNLTDEISDSQVLLILWLLEKCHFTQEEIFYGHEKFIENRIDLHKGSNYYVFDIPLNEEEEEEIEDEWQRYYQWRFMRCYLDKADLTCEEKKWFYLNAHRLKDKEEIDEKLSYELIIHLFSQAYNNMETYTNSQKTCIYFILFDYFQRHPLEILNCKKISYEEYLQILEEEPYELSSITKNKTPLSSCAAKAYVSGLEQRVLSWKEAAPVFSMEEENRISFPQIKASLRKAKENAEDGNEMSDPQKGRYLIFQYDETGDLIDVFFSAAHARKKLGLLKEQYPFYLNEKYDWNSTTLVKKVAE